MRSRLIALILVPLTVVAIIATSGVWSRVATARVATRMNQEARTVGALIGLDEAIRAQRTVEEFAQRFEDLGVSTATASTFIGVDLGAQIAPARAATYRLVGALGPSAPVSSATLRSTYAAIDKKTMTTRRAIEQFDTLDRSVVAAVGQQLDELTTNARRVGGSTLLGMINSVRAAFVLEDAAVAEGIALSAVWFPAPGASPPATPSAVALLAADHERGALELADLADLGVPSVTAVIDRMENNPQIQVFNRAVVAASAGGGPLLPTGAVDTTYVASTFRGYLARNTLVSDLTAASSTAIGDEASTIAHSQRGDLERTALAAMLLVLGMLLVAVRLAQSIARPLRKLTDYARAVNDGNIDADPIVATKWEAPEVTMVTRVLNELVANLKLVDAKTDALAHGALDAPVLQVKLPGRLGRSLTDSVDMVSRTMAERDLAWRSSIQRLATAVELRDASTGAHIERMAAYAELTARALGLPPERCAQIRAAATMHDLGKIAIPDRILRKAGALTAADRRVIETHCETGYAMLTGTGSELLELAATIALTHHERFDGTGYPRRLAGLDIPLEGRIAAVADAFDAMTSDRVYRPALSMRAVTRIMLSERGAQFDPHILDAFLGANPMPRYRATAGTLGQRREVASRPAPRRVAHRARPRRTVKGRQYEPEYGGSS